MSEPRQSSSSLSASSNASDERRPDAKQEAVGAPNDSDLGEIVERFLQEYREGKKPSVEGYAERYPDLADDIRELFPTLLALEKESSREKNSHFTATSKNAIGLEPKRLKRLNNYSIRRELGRGGMGVVYEAWDETLERLVALKVMKIFLDNEEETLKRFQREAKTVARLHHTNIVPIYGYDRSEDYFFYSMQLIEGESLDKVLRRKKREAMGRDVASFQENDRKDERTLRNGSADVKNAEQGPVFIPGIDATLGAKAFDQTTRDDISSLSDEENEKPRELLIKETAREEREFVDLAELPPLHTETKKRSISRWFAEITKNTRQDWRSRVRARVERKEREKALAQQRSQLALDDVPIGSAEYYRRVARIGAQVAGALAYAHERGVLHRDVKPSNLMLDNENDVLWITDFGLAKEQNDNELTRQGQLIGTLRYLAPEALEGRFSPLTDVYSLGLTLYEALALTSAYGETAYSKLLAQVAEARPIRPRKLDPRIPRDLETIVLKAIEREESKRYASASALADDLRRFLDDRPIAARRIGLVERGLRWSRRHKVISALVALTISLTLVAGVLLSVAYVRVHSESERAQNNLNLALEAFEAIFETLGPDAPVNINLLDDLSYATAFDLSEEMTPKDSKALESLLDFYEKFDQENQNEPELLRRSARAYSRIGRLSSILDKPNGAEALERSFQLYQRCLDAVDNVPAREEIALDMGKVALALLDRQPSGTEDERDVLEKAQTAIDALALDPKQSGAIDEQSVLEKAQTAIDALDSIEKGTGIRQEERENRIAKIRFKRAVYRMEELRKKNLPPDFFEEHSIAAPAPDARRAIEEDLDAAEKRSSALLRSNNDDSPERLLFAYKACLHKALWRRREARLEEAEKELNKAGSYVDELVSIAPMESYSELAFFEFNGAASIVYNNLCREAEDPEKSPYKKKCERTRQNAIDAIEHLVETHPRSFVYANYQILAYYYFAKRIAIDKGTKDESCFAKIDEYLDLAEKKMDDFYKNFPERNDLQHYAPIKSARAEVAIAKGELDSANETIRTLSEKLKEYDADPDKNDSLARAVQKKIERLQELLDEATKEPNDNDNER